MLFLIHPCSRTTCLQGTSIHDTRNSCRPYLSLLGQVEMWNIGVTILLIKSCWFFFFWKNGKERIKVTLSYIFSLVFQKRKINKNKYKKI